MTKLQSLANRTYEVVLSNFTCIDNWGFFLFDKEFEKEYELRTRIGVIWLCSLLDTMEAQQRFLPEIEAEAISEGFPSIAHSANELKKFCTVVGDLLSNYTREEQIYLQDHRNTLVHSYLAARHKEKIHVKYFFNGRIESEAIGNNEYHAIIRSFIEGAPHWEKVIYDLLSRVINLSSNHPYWRILGNLRVERDRIYRMLCDGEPFNIICHER